MKKASWRESDFKYLIEVNNITVRFGESRMFSFAGRKEGFTAVRNVSFNIRRGETLGLVGESGSGKSTTGRAILQLCRLTEGSICLNGNELTNLGRHRLRTVRRRMQMVFQDPYGSLNPRMTISAIVGEPLKVHRLAEGKGATARVNELLETVGIDPSLGNLFPDEFSGGQRQRIGIARALAVEPEFIVADEPTSALDVSIQAQIINLLKRIQKEHQLTYLFISHNLPVVGMMADRIAVMRSGQILETIPTERIHEEASHPYTRALIAAVPIPDPRLERARLERSREGDGYPDAAPMWPEPGGSGK